MARKIEVGPLVALAGAVLLLVSLFLEWFAPGASAWDVFESLDLLLAGLAIGAGLAALGMLAPELAVLSRRWLAPLGVLALIIVASQLLDPPPAVAEGERAVGAWLALAAAALIAAGAALSFSRVRFAVTVEGRELRQRQAAVVTRDRQRAAGGANGTASTVGAEGPGGARAASPAGTAPEAVDPRAAADSLTTAPPREA